LTAKRSARASLVAGASKFDVAFGNQAQGLRIDSVFDL
jgi:hypothetical protein